MTTLLSLLAAVAFVLLDPAQVLTPAAFVAPARGLVVAAAGLLAATGAGAALLRRTGLLDGRLGWLWALGAGIGLHAGLLTLLTFAGWLSPVTSVLVLLALAAGWVVAPPLDRPRVSAFAFLLVAVLLAPALVEALAPPTDTDELSYQLAVPHWIARTGGLDGGVLHPEQSRPLPVQVLFAGLTVLGGAPAARFWHLGVAVALLLGVRTVAEARFGPGRGDLPALALAGSWSFLREAGLAANDLPVALWVLLAAVAVLDRRPVAGAWMGGLAVAAKFTAVPAIAVLGLLAVLDRRRIPLPALLGLVTPVVPWLLRNLLRGDHPLFPFAGWPAVDDFVFVYAEKYGVGHGWADALRLPFDLLFRAEPESFVFYGRLSLLWALLPLALPALRRPDVRRLWVVVGVGFLAWAGSAQLLRYLLPLAGVAAVLLGAVRPGVGPWLLFAVSLPANLAPAWSRAVDRVPVVLGAEDPDTFLTRVLPAWPAVRYVRDWVPRDETVALLNCWPAWYVDQPTVLGSVEDHVPVRHWVLTHGPDSVRALADAGVRWLLVGDAKYLRKSYAFLPEPVWRSQLRAPQETLEAALRRDAVRVFAANHHAVWRVEPPSP